MKIIYNVSEMQIEMKKYQDKVIGFVPTMGFLHEGHLSLIDESVKVNDITVLSIFVNPLQFGPNEDYDSYPRDLKKDEDLARNHAVDILFIPQSNSMYPEKLIFSITVLERTQVLCGKNRPGHFDGVVTVLTKLFNIINPDIAYFGMKDAQQLAIVHSFVEQFNFRVKIVGLRTIRESSGLAKSSRNVNLTPEEIISASGLSQALFSASDLIQSGVKGKQDIIDHVKNKFSITNKNIDLEYVELLSYPKLEEIEEVADLAVLAVAVKYSEARLIDNLILTADGEIMTRF